jgi:hypothetical protein
MSFIIWNAVHNTLERLYQEISWAHIPTQEETMQRFFGFRESEMQQARLAAGHDQLFDQDYETKQHDTALEYIQRYYQEYHPFDQDITMQTEMTIHEELTQEISFSGKIDRLWISGDTFTIYDYKTSKSYDPDNNDKVKKQLILYSGLIARRYAQKCKRIIAKAIYLRLHNEITREVTPEMIGEILQEYQKTAQTIVDHQAAYSNNSCPQNQRENLFPTQSGTHCAYCPYQIHCPLFKHQFMDDENVTLSDMSTTTIKELIDKYRAIKLQIKAQEEQLELYKELLVPYALNHDYKRLYGHSTKLGIRTQITYKHKPQTATELQKNRTALTQLPLERIVTINDREIQKLITAHTIDPTPLTQYLTEHTTSFIASHHQLKEKEKDEIGDIIGE